MSHRSAIFVTLCLTAVAHGQLRVASWNVSQFDGADRTADIQRALYGTFQGRRMAPDVLCVQEVNSNAALQTLLAALNTAPGYPSASDPGSPGDWAAASFVDGPDLDNVLLYRTTRVVLVRDTTTIALGSTDSANQPRHTYRWDIRPAGYASLPAHSIGIYGVHMKAGSASEDNTRRLVESRRIRDNAEGIDTNGAGTGLPDGYHFLVLGDFNMQSSGQSSYVELVGAQSDNSGRFFDPINQPGSWNNAAGYAAIHTQDPTGPGGMDDRHDQILLSTGLLDATGMDYLGQLTGPQNPVPFDLSTWNDPRHSYRVWGNDGSTYNAPMAIFGNTMVGSGIAQAIANACTTTGGHLPVFLDLRVAPRAATVASIDFGTVPLGSTAERTVTVTNLGDTALWTAAGIGDLSYTIIASTGFSAPAGPFADAAGGGGDTQTVSMSTSTPGPRSGTLTIATNDPEHATLVVTLTGAVSAGNQPPIARAGPDQDIVDNDGDGQATVILDGSASTDDGGIVDYRWLEGNAVRAAGPSPIASVSFPVGPHTITLRVRDSQGLVNTDDVLIRVLPACDPDVNCDGVPDQDDVACIILAVAGDLSCFCQADPDFNGDGVPDQGDVADIILTVAGAACP